MDRRSGGRNLFRFLKENFEDKGQPYHVVGHSHGGSVIAECLRYSVFQKSRLENLQSWISVATPFLAFQKSKQFLKRVKRRYQLLVAILVAYILAVLLAVPIGMCTPGVGGNSECWVEKSHSDFFDFENVTAVHADLTHQEGLQLTSLGKRGDDNDVHSWLGSDGYGSYKRGENEVLIEEEDAPTIRSLELKFKSQASVDTPVSFTVANINFAKPELVPQIFSEAASEVADEAPQTTAFAQGKPLAGNFKQLAMMEYDERGHFPFDMCAPETLEFFSLTDPTFLFDTHGEISGRPEFWPESYTFRDHDPFEIDQYELEYNKPVYKYDLMAFKDDCAKTLNGQAPDPRITHWARDIGFKDPKTLTFRAQYGDGKRRMFRLHFHTMDGMKITPFIPRSEVIKSRGLLMYLGFNAIPILIAMFLLWRAQKHLRRRYGHAGEEQFADWYKDRWIKLSHPEDEAINSIAASTKAELQIAPPDMLQGMFMLAFSSVMAIVLMFNGVKLINWAWPGNSLGFQRELIEELGYAINRAHSVLHGTGSFSGTNLTGWKSELPMTVFFNNDGGLSILSLVIVFGIILIGFIFLGRMAEKYILNPMLRKGIDGIAQSSATRGAFGDDSLGESGLLCQSYPSEFEDPHQGEFPLPVQKAIEDYANQDLVKLPGKFRAVLYKNVSKTDNFTLSDLLEGELGEILLHTSYFNVEEFHDLFAAALTSTGDFAPSPAFKTHKTASQWFAGLKAAR